MNELDDYDHEDGCNWAGENFRPEDRECTCNARFIATIVRLKRNLAIMKKQEVVYLASHALQSEEIDELKLDLTIKRSKISNWSDIAKHNIDLNGRLQNEIDSLNDIINEITEEEL